MCDCDIEPILCGGCGLIIREFEEGVWVRGGSDECEAGGVHAPPTAPRTGDLVEIFVPLTQSGTYLWDQALRTDPSEKLPEYRWVRFIECPF